MLRRIVPSTIHSAIAYNKQVAAYHTALQLLEANNTTTTTANNATNNESTKLNPKLVIKQKEQELKLKELQKKLQKENQLKLQLQTQKRKELEKKLQLQNQQKLKKEKLKMKEQLQQLKSSQEGKIKTKKEKHLPKRALTPLLWYTTLNFNVVKSELLQSNQLNKEDKITLQFSKVQSELKRRWDSLDEKNKEYYLQLSLEDKLRFTKEKNLYLKKKELNKRPATSFLRYFMDIRENLKNENPNASVTELSKMAGEKWRNLESSVKRKYEEAYERDLEEFRNRQ
ncbi:hypothetical protein ABK040_010745 [Willaertia magna]